MQNITDHPSIERYSEEFTKVILDSYFSENDQITGPEILNLTPIRQVNLLVIKSLLFQWKKESENLKSPYFNFAHEEVQKALTSFMNTVSRHISVNRKNLEPLLKQAITDSILLIFFPYVFYTEMLNGWKEQRIHLKDLKQISKYIKVNDSLMASLIQNLSDSDLIHIDKEAALELFNQILENTDLTPADTDDFEKNFDEVVAFDLNNFMKDTETDESQEENTEEENPEEESAQEEKVVHNIYDQDEIVEEDLIDENYEQNNPDFEEHEDEVKTVNDELKESERTTLADIHEKQRIEKISKYISINQKFMFINSLFDKDWSRFEKAINFLDSSSDKDEITSYLDEYAPAWREENEEAEEFRIVLEKKLGEPIG